MENVGKTPVSLLQEYLVARNMVAEYNYVGQTGPSHCPTFTVTVKVGGLCIEGEGKSMQKAKHMAAQNMLIALECQQEKEEETKYNNAECFLNEKGENYVAKLSEICLKECYPEPKYESDEGVGPSHCKIFKCVCRVSTLKGCGTSKTKKLAKQHAAYKMILKLKNLGNVNIKQNCTPTCVPDPENENVESTPSVIKEKISVKVNMGRTATNVKPREPVTFYKDHYKAYFGLPETSPTLLKVTENKNLIQNNSCNLLSEIAKELGVQLTDTLTTLKDDEKGFVIVMSLNPPAAAFGMTKEEAAFNLLETLLVLCDEF